MIWVSGSIVCEIISNGDAQRVFLPLNAISDPTEKAVI